MNQNKARELAVSLMAKHGVTAPFSFDRGKARLGVCKFRRIDGVCTGISLSAYWTEAMNEDEVRDVILHEIAHALAGINENHGPRWRSIARSIGASPTRCAAPSEEVKARMETIAPAAWTGTCPAGHTYSMHRAPGRVKSCTKCSPRFNKAHIITWTKNGRQVPMPAKYAAEMQRIQNGMTSAPRPKRPMSLEDMFGI